MTANNNPSISQRVAEFCNAHEGMITYHQLAMRQQELVFNELIETGGTPVRESIEKAWEKALDEAKWAAMKAETRAHCQANSALLW